VAESDATCSRLFFFPPRGRSCPEAPPFHPRCIAAHARDGGATMSDHARPQWPDGVLSDEDYASLLLRARGLAPTFVDAADLVHEAIIVLIRRTSAREKIHDAQALCWNIIKDQHADAFRKTLRAAHLFAPEELLAPPDCSSLAAWFYKNLARFRNSLPPVQRRIFDHICSEDSLSDVARALQRDKKQVREATRILRKKLRIFLSEYPPQRLNR
jgi:DNA-directed RNA polymerase specialized sigma24 family protein